MQPVAESPSETAAAAKPEIQCAWKEFSAPDGRKYYYNRTTKESKWQMPEELKQANAFLASLKTQKSTPADVQVCPALLASYLLTGLGTEV